MKPVPSSERRDAAPSCSGTLCGGICVDVARDPAHCGACGVACPKDAGCVVGLCTTGSGWSWVPRTASDAGGCEKGKRIAVRCPAGGSASSVWGTDLYTDDSSVCTAAVHAGKLTFASGGDVAIETRDGALSYAGTARNGVTSHGWAAWGCSFVFLSRECSADARLCGEVCADLSSDAQHCGACGHACGHDESCKKGSCVSGIDATFATTLREAKCTPGTMRTLHCPPGPLPSPVPTVWGSSVYTHDSAVCVAAVHAGKIIATTGGTVVVELRAGEPKYLGSTANGVTTNSYGAWTCSFVFR